MAEAIVTGLGCITALGDNVPQFWDGLVAGASGISPIRGFRRELMRNDAAGEIRLSPQSLEHARQMGITSRLALFAKLAMDEALRQSELDAVDLRDREVGLVVGVSLGMSLVRGGVESVSENADALAETDDDLSDLAGGLADRAGIRGAALTVSTACAAGTNAIGIARDMIAFEGYDAVICGGADTLDRMKYLGHTALNTLTPTSIQPCAAERNGTIFGEGAGMLVLESANGRNAKAPLALCSGSGFSCDAHDITAPDPSGAAAIHAMKEALRDAGLRPQDIHYVNLHGSGTIHNDAAECKAIGDVFGSAAASLPASSVKAAIGHVMGAAGACEAVATVLALLHQKIPPTVNTRGKDPALPVNLICGSAIDWKIEHALSNSFGFGGCNGSVVFSKWR